MKNLIAFIAFLTLISCASTENRVKYKDKSPRGISILNITKSQNAKAYQTATSHCYKYNKVAKIRKILKQTLPNQDDPDLQVEEMSTIIFLCIRP